MLLSKMALATGIAAFIGAAGYTATLAPPAGSSFTVTGSATVSGTSASVTLANGTPGATYPWHVHVGTCATGGGIFGSPSAYKPITIKKDGTGMSTAKLSMAIPDSGSYHVNIHHSSSDMKTIVSCGDLTMSGM
jgi:copper chaperone CopZ